MNRLSTLPVFPLRRLLLTRALGVVLGTMALVAAIFISLGMQPMADQLAAQAFEGQVGRVQAALVRTFEPAHRLLAMSAGWLGGRAPSLSTPQAFNLLYQPVLQSIPQITSVVAGTDDGQGWLLLNRQGLGWRNRMTDVAHWGQNQHELYDWDPTGGLTRQRLVQHYDPRERPWFLAAMRTAHPREVVWTAPYVFFTTGDAGVTAAARSTLLDGRTLVMGFDVMLRDLSKVTQAAQVGEQGMALVLSEDFRVVALPRAPSGTSAADWARMTLKPVDELPVAALRVLGLGGVKARAGAGLQTFQLGDARWLVDVRTYRLGDHAWWVVVLAPVNDFAPRWASIAVGLALALLLVLGVTLFLSLRGARGLTQPLQQLVQASEKLGRLDFSEAPPVPTRALELAELAQGIDKLRDLLHQDQRQISQRAHELQDRLVDLSAARDQLHAQNAQLAAIIEHFPGGVTVVDADLNLRAWNRAFQQLMDLPDALLLRSQVPMREVLRTYAERGDYGPGDVDQQVAQRLDLLRSGQPHRLECTTAAGRVIDIRGTPLPNGGLLTSYLDVTLERAREHQLQHLAHHDSLTGLPSRVLLADRLRQAMAQGQRTGKLLALVYLDLDGFKLVNDTHGHAAGDVLLRELAQRMKQALRDGDTLARLGGDEFVALLVDVGRLEGALASVQRLLVAAHTPVQHAGATLQVSASAGVSLYPQGPEVDAEQLMRQADQAMYQAKKQGRNGYQVFDAARELHERGQIEGSARVRLALQRGELVLHYQPKVDMQRGQVVGAEALLRWQHPERGLLSPGAFLPLIEGQDLSVEVGHWVIEQALGQMAAWRAQGLALPLSVNVGALELQDTALVPHLREMLQRHAQVPAADLQLEILETRALDDLARVSETMAECHALGVCHALDDFGTGYASLSYFKRLPVDELKIDQSFVRDMLDDPDDLAILTGILNLARAFDRRVIAEGVESEATGRLLIQLGCPRAQGYAIARPMPAAELVDWVQTWQPPALWTQARTLPAVHQAVLVMAVEMRAWVGTLQSFLSGVRKSPPQLDILRCNLGQWLSHIDPTWRDWPCVQRLPDLHDNLHALAADLAAAGAQPQALQGQAWAQILFVRDALAAALDELAQRVADQAH